MMSIHRQALGMGAIILGLMFALGACADSFTVSEDSTADTFTLSTDGGVTSTTFTETDSGPFISAFVKSSSSLEIQFADSISGTVLATFIQHHVGQFQHYPGR